MSESRRDGTSIESQLQVPPAFVALYQPSPHRRPTLSVAELLVRHEWCEDLAQSLVEPARTLMWRIQGEPQDVLAQVRTGLQAIDPPLPPQELPWVLGRVAELLDWPTGGDDGMAPAA